EYDFVIYRADLNPKEIYGEGWMKHVMPINRVINQLESSVYDYATKVAKGRIVVDRDAQVRSIHNVHGEIISKARGSEIRPLDLPPLPIAVQNLIERMNRYLEDIGQVHDASLGRIPAGVKSGIGIAELKQADATGQDDLVDNLEDFLSEVASKILRKISENYTTYHIVQALGVREGEEKYFAVVGAKSGKKGNKDHNGQVKIGPDWLDLAVIGDDNQIRVTIGSWLGYTKEMMQEKVLKLLEAGAIDQKTFLRLWEFGGVDEIVQETRKEQLLHKAIENMSGASGQNPGEEDQYGLAMTENDMMVLEAKDMPVDPHDDHVVHLAVHQEALGRGEDDLVNKHMSLHMMYMNQPGQSSYTEGLHPADQSAPNPMMGQQPPLQSGQPQPGQPQQPQPNVNQMMGQPTSQQLGAAMAQGGNVAPSGG
ncbi:MAG: hypothetical protein KGL39_54420, partial [Patescibacteria group bacterium]|nr:hypothetical protein [Patescibacteria group bacterium]